jgi:hypothetical protein
VIRLVVLVVLAFLGFPATASAQIVNVQGALAKQPEKDGVTGQLELRLDWRQGNNVLFDAGASANVMWRRGRFLGLALARGEIGRNRDTIFKQRTFEHLRARMTIDCRWKWEAFTQHELDRFRRINVRALGGTGPALQVIESDPISILAGASYMYEYERFDRRMGASDAGARMHMHRASFYITGTEKVGETVAITQTFYVQPRIDEPSDVRLLGELSLTSKLSKRVALTDAFIVAYDATPPEGIRRYDTQLRVTLLITF